jgi:hypothetical protein
MSNMEPDQARADGSASVAGEAADTHSDPGTSSKRSTDDDEKRSDPPGRSSIADRLLVPIFVAIVTAAAAIGGSFVGATKANDGNAAIQQQAIAEQRAKDDRDKKADIYLHYLENANTYANSVEDAYTCIYNYAIAPEPKGSAPQSCIDAINRLQTPRFDYQGSINELYIYGSDEANRAHRAVSATLPASVGYLTVPGTGLPPLNEVFGQKFDRVAFGRAYSNFLKIVCMEVPARPRPNC